MVTADNITDEQIRDHQRRIAGFVFPAAGFGHTEMSEDYETCREALEAPFGSLRRAQARARCAEILNARAASGGGK